MDEKNKNIAETQLDDSKNKIDFEMDDMLDESFIIDYEAQADPYDPDMFDDIDYDDF